MSLEIGNKKQNNKKMGKKLRLLMIKRSTRTLFKANIGEVFKKR